MVHIAVPSDKQIFVNARAIICREIEGELHYLIQRRDRAQERAVWEFPGGTVEAGESLLAAVRREVLEETGLMLSEVEGEESLVVAHGAGSLAECVQPYAVYQVTDGFNGMGVYFRCRATGEPLAKGDGSHSVHWLAARELRRWYEEGAEPFAAMTAVALKKLVRDNLL